MSKKILWTLNFLLLANTPACKTKAHEQNSSSLRESNLPKLTCPTELALTEINMPPLVDSTTLMTQNLKFDSIPLSKNNSAQILRLQFQGDAKADFVYYEICRTGTSECKQGIFANNSQSTGLTYEGRLDAGDYTASVSSAIWSDREKNKGAKKLSSKQRPGRSFAKGPALTSSVKKFAGTPQPYRDLFTQIEELDNKNGALLQNFQSKLAGFNDALFTNSDLAKSVHNIIHLREQFKSFIESPVLRESNNALEAAKKVKNSTGLNLADSASNCSKVLKLATQTSSDARTSLGLAEAFSDDDRARMNCDGTPGYQWAQDDSGNFSCAPKSSSTISGALVTAAPDLPMAGQQRNDKLFISGLSLLSIGSVVGIGGVVWKWKANSKISSEYTGGISRSQPHVNYTNVTNAWRSSPFSINSFDTSETPSQSESPRKSLSSASHPVYEAPSRLPWLPIIAGAATAITGAVMTGLSLQGADAPSQLMTLANTTATELDKNLKNQASLRKQIATHLGQ